MALSIFAGERVDTAVMEVGMGGRLDATNVISPGLCVITPVDFDHEAYLGKSLEAIAGEKAGILKPGVPAVFARQRTEAGLVLERRAAELGVAVTRTREWEVTAQELNPRGSRFRLAGERELQIDCPLADRKSVV